MAENAEDQGEETKEVLEIVEDGDDVYALVLIGEDGDEGNAVGNVYIVPGDPDVDFEPVLWTNDTLRVLTRSPKGSLWTASSDGNVLTTAKVKWLRPTDRDLEFDSLEGTPHWRATTLPDLQKDGYAPSITAMAAVSDSEVYAGTFTGSVYRWDGVAWAEVWNGSAGSIHRILGIGDGRAIAVGADSTILYGDGTRWKRLRDPDGAKSKNDISAVLAMGDDRFLLCDQSGRLLHGGAGGFAVLSRHDLSFFAAGMFEGRIFLAAGPDGVAEIVRGAVTIANPKVEAVGVYPGAHKIYFIEAAPDEPSYVHYDPKKRKSPWNETVL